MRFLAALALAGLGLAGRALYSHVTRCPCGTKHPRHQIDRRPPHVIAAMEAKARVREKLFTERLRLQRRVADARHYNTVENRNGDVAAWLRKIATITQFLGDGTGPNGEAVYTVGATDPYALSYGKARMR